jgi:hypothetical protein
MNGSINSTAYRRIFEVMKRDRHGNGVLPRALTLPLLGGYFCAAALLTGGIYLLLHHNLTAFYWNLPVVFFTALVLTYLLLLALILALHPLFCRILYTGDHLVERVYFWEKKIHLDYGKPQVELEEDGTVVFRIHDEQIRVDFSTRGGYELYCLLQTEHGIAFPSRLAERFEIAREKVDERDR